MSRMMAVGCVAVCFSLLVMGGRAGWGQASGDAVSAPAGVPTTPQTAASAPATSTAPAEQKAAEQAAPAVDQVAPAEKTGKTAEKTGKGKKAAYSGPTEIIVLPPTLMLDEEGRQRIDPDGQPMFNPAVKQQRDKHGHPLFDEQGKPVMQTAQNLGYDEHSKRIKAKKEKLPRPTPVTISRGTFTVDGVIGKAALNYEIADLKYLYLYVPGIGVTVVSHAPFAGAKEQKNAFDDRSLIVTVSEHRLEVASDVPLLGRKRRPESAYVRLDRGFMLPSEYPEIGYGELLARPYGWPASKENATLQGPVQPPELPSHLRQTQVRAPCPEGQMRQSGAAVAAGQSASGDRCVPIPSTPAGTVPAAAQPGKTDAQAAASSGSIEPSKE